ncbi:MAG: hypothetical protein IJY06_11115 [Oscillospiraceae bacterium]|nr:hypothetical protein [Oscillospiraceae bacterium]
MSNLPIVPMGDGKPPFDQIKYVLEQIKDIIDCYRTTRELSYQQRSALRNQINTIQSVQRARNLEVVIDSDIRLLEFAQRRIEEAKLSGECLDAAMDFLDEVRAILIADLRKFKK